MPNDAKLGLLVGVIGVIMAASLSLSRPPTHWQLPPKTSADVRSSPAVESTSQLPSSPIARSSEPVTTPTIRTKPDVDARPASRQPDEDINP
jgi:hypothetical protein